MSLSASEALCQAAWLSERLEAAALQEIRPPRRDTPVLSFRRPGETVHLVLATGAGRARLHTVARPPQNPSPSHAFQGLLRKELQGALQALDCIEGDRVVVLKFSSRDGVERSLVAELTGRHGNFFLLDENGSIQGSAKAPHSSTRPLHSGDRWTPPPRHDTPSTDRFAPLQGEERDEAVRSHYLEFERRQQLVHLQQRLRSMLNARRRKLTKTARKQENEAARGDGAAQLRREAELIQSAFHQLQKGMTELAVDDYYSDPPVRVSVSLDPKLSPGEQVEKRYQKAKRAERAGKTASERLGLTKAELVQVEELLSRVATAATEAELRTLEAELPAHLRRALGEGRQRSSTTSKRGGQGPRLPYISYRTAQGIELRVGRGARENDDLTFRHSRGNDVWLHVRGRPGAHVVICRPGPSPALELLLLGAQLALAHSSIKEGAREEVAWTRVKEVHKPKGMTPGKVLVRQEKVLYVEAQRAALQELTRA